MNNSTFFVFPAFPEFSGFPGFFPDFN